MEDWQASYFLKQLVPDLEFDRYDATHVNPTNFYNEQKMIVILSNHFNEKRRRGSHRCTEHKLKAEVMCMKKIFPSLKSAYLLKQLEIFKDLPNRKEIVLRLVLDSKRSGNTSGADATSTTAQVNVKRVLPFVQVFDSVYNDIQPHKIRKVAELPAPMQFPPRTPEEVNSVLDLLLTNNKPCTITSSSEKQESMSVESPLASAFENNFFDYPNVEADSRSTSDSNSTYIYDNLEDLAIPSDVPTPKLPLDLSLDPHAAEKSGEAVLISPFDVNLTDSIDVSPEFSLQGSAPMTAPYSTTCEPNQQIVIKDETIDLSSPDVAPLEPTYDPQLVSQLCSVFPDACPVYIKELSKNKKLDDVVLNNLITIILDTNNQYPKRPPQIQEPEVYPENQLDILREFLPDADPDYLRMMCDGFEGKAEMVQAFLNEAMERRHYPTMKDYQRRQQLSSQQKQYTSEFSVENFVKLIPDPESFFGDSSRVLKWDDVSLHYAIVFLRNKFNKLSVKTIQTVFTKKDFKLSLTIKELKEMMLQPHSMMKSVRKQIPMPSNIQNIPLLQEIAYYTHEDSVRTYLVQLRGKEETERADAKVQGLLKVCGCCFDEEVLPKEIFCCEKGCQFCKSCVVKSTEVLFGEGKLIFPCLLNCSSFFSLQCLQAVLPPKLFSKIAQKKALEEIKAAGIEDLEMCPFCDFATIPAEGYNIFTCLNADCMKESCRMCKEPSHIPLRCDEIEKDEDVRARTFVENQMTEALLRKCWKCNIKFFKEEGCNKMTCSCGAQMCYVCCQPVTDYKHFNGNGGDRYDLCPLYSDSVVLNKENVLKGAEQAKAQIGSANLKHDPSKDVEQHFESRKVRVGEQPMMGANREEFGILLMRMQQVAARRRAHARGHQF